MEDCNMYYEKLLSHYQLPLEFFNLYSGDKNQVSQSVPSNKTELYSVPPSEVLALVKSEGVVTENSFQSLDKCLVSCEKCDYLRSESVFSQEKDYLCGFTNQSLKSLEVECNNFEPKTAQSYEPEVDDYT